MWKPTWPGRSAPKPARRRERRRDLAPLADILESRLLLTASLQPIAAVAAPAQQGYVVPLDGGANPNAQTFTVTSSNPDVAVSVAAGPFWTLNVQYTDPVSIANSFSGPVTFQLFQDLTPTTVNEISTFTNDGYYTNKTFHRIVAGFPNSSGYILQGGAPNPDGTGNSGQPGTPFINEPVQPLTFSGSYQIAMANAGPNTNDTQFFVTTGAPSFLNYNYNLFGQLVAGASTINRMTTVPVQYNSVLNEVSRPVNPVTISSASLASTNPNGSLIVDTTQAKAGETSTITVTANDPADPSIQVRTFVVTVGAYGGPTNPVINLRPFANATTLNAVPNRTTTASLSGLSGYPNPATPATLTYAIVSLPTHGVLSQFNATTGSYVYTPTSGYVGPDSFRFLVRSAGPKAAPVNLASNPATVSISVNTPSNDFDATGKSEVAVFRPSTAEWFAIGPSGGHSLGTFGATQLTDIPVPGDYDGTGHTELAVFRPSTAQWFVLSPSGGRLLGTFGATNLTDIPVPGDYDGLGHTELAVFRPSTAQWFVMGPSGGRLLGTFGATNLTDIPVPGDYDGLGHTELAVFRPSTAQWFVMGPSGGRLLGTFGATNLTDVPVPGDYEGIGHTQMAVFRPSTAQWFVNGLNGGHLVATFGGTNYYDVPASAVVASLKKLGKVSGIHGASIRTSGPFIPATAAPSAASQEPANLRTFTNVLRASTPAPGRARTIAKAGAAAADGKSPFSGRIALTKAPRKAIVR